VKRCVTVLAPDLQTASPGFCWLTSLPFAGAGFFFFSCIAAVHSRGQDECQLHLTVRGDSVGRETCSSMHTADGCSFEV
jgi:hypothetical protein